ncbi:XRE family transcriptional regulator [Pseudoalteromonas sp. Of11M-6]|uniref:LexA family protein n=1 Tax=Pseudoalteromonas sp. Of11M-6 TaxID=2917754 RepID=UPI001EF7400F|nr:XRE family transcriptional regulator [Pseudoalteromonas sp. Of11M-6]MCG7551969.1 XRE family transcriptional regulator [Pseudoalteromonas sp. Of11M-6]
MSIGERIRNKRKSLGLTQAALSEMVGIAQQSLQSIESGKIEKPRRIMELAKALETTPEYLQFGVGDLDNASIGPELKNKLPLISWVQAGAWTDIQEVSTLEAEHFLCPVNCSDKSFVLRVQGVSMEPKFDDGDLIFVDPEAECIHGSFVVARLDDDNQATFKQLIIEGGQKFLKALNPNWPEQLVPINGNCTLVGKVVFTGKSL